MKGNGVILIAWWLYVATLMAVPSSRPGEYVMAWNWVPKDRFLRQDTCERQGPGAPRVGPASHVSVRE